MGSVSGQKLAEKDRIIWRLSFRIILEVERMEWISSLKRAIDYMEEHLLEEIDAGEVAEKVFISPFYFQKGFKIVTGYSMGEYIRNRRLYLAALDVIRGKEQIIQLAYRYGYDTPESFTKAFSRFHGVSPTQLVKDPSRMQTFLPLTVEIAIKGGNRMDYVVEEMEAFQIIGFERSFATNEGYQEIPKFWDEFCRTCKQPMLAAGRPEGEIQQAVADYRIGEFGVCVDDMPGEGKFRYFIGGRYTGGPIPEGMGLYDIPALSWAKFRCIGPLPGALQSLNDKIFKEWLPGNVDYEIAEPLNLEWYSGGNTIAYDYESGIWIPVRKR